MSHLNKNTKSSNQPDSYNLADGKSFKRTNLKQELISMVLNVLDYNDTYYLEHSEVINNMLTLIKKIDDNEFIAKLMVYSRNELGLRYISKVLGDYLIKNASGTNYLVAALYKSFIRVDDITDQFALSGKKSNALRKAAKRALEDKFDEYQFRKYQGLKNQVKLKDVVKLTRPNPLKYKFNDKFIYKKIIENKLKNIVTAQTLNSSDKNYAGNLDKLGYIALIKNICNILKQDPHLYDQVKDMIYDKERIKKSKILPFRFYDAIIALKDLYFDQSKIQKLQEKLYKGLTISAEELQFNGTIALCLDESGSMAGKPFKYGKTLTAGLLRNNIGYLWADDCQKIKYSEGLDFILYSTARGGGTYVEEPLRALVETRTFVDMIIIFTDMQMYDKYGRINNHTFKNQLKKYKKINPNVKLVWWNLLPYGGSTPIRFDRNVIEICSCSDKMIPLIPKFLENPNFLIENINNIELVI